MTSKAQGHERPVGEAIRRFREESGLSLGQLAERANISKSYLWNLESRQQDKRPSAKVLFEIAKALGVTLADLYGQSLTVDEAHTVDPTLDAFAKEADLPAADVRMLASIEWRGDAPKSTDRWRYIYQAIRMSRELDR